MLVVGLWLTPFLLGRLGVSDYGLWLVATQVMGFLALLDFGVLGLLPRDAAVASGVEKAGGEGPSVATVIGRSARLLLYLQPLLAAAALGVWLLMPDEWAGLRRPLGLLFIAFVLLFPTRLLTAALQGLQEQAYSGWATIAGWTCTTAVTVALVFAGWRLNSLAAGWAAGQSVTAAMAFMRLRARHRERLPRGLPAVSSEVRADYMRRGGWVTLSSVAQILLVGTDMLIIAKVLGPAAVVPFAITGKLMSVLANQPQLVMQMALPGLAEMRGEADRGRILDVSRALAQLMLLLSGGVLFVVVLVNSTFVSWWVGPSQYGGTALTAALLASMIVRHWNATMTYTTFLFGNERQIALLGTADGIVTVIAAVLLVRAIGPIGAPLGSLIGVCLVSVPRYLTLLSREFGMTRWALVAPLLPWAWRTVLLVVAAAIIGWSPRPGGFLFVVASASLAGIVYLATQAPVVLRPPLGTYLKPRIDALRARFQSRASA